MAPPDIAAGILSRQAPGCADDARAAAPHRSSAFAWPWRTPWSIKPPLTPALSPLRGEGEKKKSFHKLYTLLLI